MDKDVHGAIHAALAYELSYFAFASNDDYERDVDRATDHVLAALAALAPAREPSAAERDALTDDQRESLAAVLAYAQDKLKLASWMFGVERPDVERAVRSLRALAAGDRP